VKFKAQKERKSASVKGPAGERESASAKTKKARAKLNQVLLDIC
jgi:hypothetical protein